MTFGRHLSIAQFKELCTTKEFHEIKNPNPLKKNFIVAVDTGKTVAAVSGKLKADQPQEFVELIEGATTLWCLHNPNSSNVVRTF